MTAIACSSSGDRKAGGQHATDGVTGTTQAASVRDDRQPGQSADSSPFVVGVWKFIPGDHGGTPKVDTEFRFVNPTGLQDVKLEYAFFNLDGSFCGCDRDDFPPNHTTIYTMFAEATTVAPCSSSMPPAGCPRVPPPNSTHLFNCTDQSGALKAITFKHQGQRIFFDDTTEVGFQTHVFGGIVETPPTPPGGTPAFNFIQGNVMTEAAMAGVAVTDAARAEAETIHDGCIALQGSL
jgi:hypothetical protein